MGVMNKGTHTKRQATVTTSQLNKITEMSSWKLIAVVVAKKRMERQVSILYCYNVGFRHKSHH